MSTPNLNVVRCVNPEDEAVEIHPQDILYVSLACDGVTWKSQSLSNIAVKSLRMETFENDSFERCRMGNFKLIPFASVKTLEYHFWFRIDPKDCLKLNYDADTRTPITTLIFSDSNSKEVGRLTILVKTNPKIESAVEKYVKILESTKPSSGRDIVEMEAWETGLKQHIEDMDEGYILNPKSMQTVVLTPNQELMLIEVVAPDNDRFMATPVMCGEESNNLEVLVGNDRIINGKIIQKFFVQNTIPRLPKGIRRIHLGIVELSSLEQKSHLNFWLSEENDTCRIITVSEPPEELQLKKSEVSIEEISPVLADNAKLLKVFIPVERIKRVFDPENNRVVSLPEDVLLSIRYWNEMDNETKKMVYWRWVQPERPGMLELAYVVTKNISTEYVFKLRDSSSSPFQNLLFVCGDGNKKSLTVCRMEMQSCI